MCGCGEDVARALAIDDSEYGPEHREVAITLTIHRKECLHAGSCNLFLFTCHIFSCATDASRCINGWSMSICLTCFSLARSAHHLPWGPPKITNSQVHYHIPIEHYKTRGSVRKRFSERTLPHNKTACFFAFHNIPTLQNTYLKKHARKALIHIRNRSLLIRSLLFTRFQRVQRASCALVRQLVCFMRQPYRASYCSKRWRSMTASTSRNIVRWR